MQAITLCWPHSWVIMIVNIIRWLLNFFVIVVTIIFSMLFVLVFSLVKAVLRCQLKDAPSGTCPCTCHTHYTRLVRSISTPFVVFQIIWTLFLAVERLFVGILLPFIFSVFLIKRICMRFVRFMVFTYVFVVSNVISITILFLEL